MTQKAEETPQSENIARQDIPQAGRLYGGLTQERRLQERRRRLIEAGLDIFSSEGYTRTPIERICGVARVATRHFYELFSNKEALLIAVLDYVMDNSRAAVFRAIAIDTDDPRERFRPGISAFVHSYLDDPRHVRIALVEVVGVSLEVEKHRREIEREFHHIIQSQIDLMAGLGLMPKRDYSLVSQALGGAINQLLIDWAYMDNPTPVDRIIDELAGFFQAAIRGMQAEKGQAPHDQVGVRT
jgi:AcrR family transcriptional regulator